MLRQHVRWDEPDRQGQPQWNNDEIVELTQNRDDLVLVTSDEHRAAAVKDLIESKAVRRGLSLKIFEWGKVEEAGGNRVRQQIGLRRGLTEANTKKMPAAVVNHLHFKEAPSPELFSTARSN